MFKAFGHKRASVLNGGLPAWESYGLHIEEFAPGEAGAVEYPIPTLDQNVDRKSTRLNSSHSGESRMPSSA